MGEGEGDGSGFSVPKPGASVGKEKKFGQSTPQTEVVPPVERLTSKTLEKLAGFGFVASGAPAPLTDETDPRAAAVPGWLGGCVVPGHVPASQATARLGFAQRDGLLVTWLVVSPTLHDDLLVALRAHRLFEIERDTLRVD